MLPAKFIGSRRLPVFCGDNVFAIEIGCARAIANRFSSHRYARDEWKCARDSRLRCAAMPLVPLREIAWIGDLDHHDHGRQDETALSDLAREVEVVAIYKAPGGGSEQAISFGDETEIAPKKTSAPG
jgi:hypothetical protein